ncbi:hypothetical protein V8F33_002451 [Rhypophila sp. PSN 637]
MEDYTVAPAPQRLIPYSRNWYLTKIILRIICFLLSAVVLGLATNSGLSNVNGYKGMTTLPPAICVMVWNFIELSIVLVRYNVRRGIHPGFSVAGDLILWLVCLVCAFFSVAIGVNLFWRIYENYYDFYNYYTPMDMIVTILLSILTVIHFTLFVRACVETKQRNDSKKEDLYVYMYAPGGGRPIPVMPMKEQNNAAIDDLKSEAGTVWGDPPHSVVSPSVGITDRHTIMSSNKTPTVMSDSLPAVPPSVYSASGMGMGDGFNGYQGPTDEAEAHRYHSKFGDGQKEIIPADLERRVSRA